MLVLIALTACGAADQTGPSGATTAATLAPRATTLPSATPAGTPSTTLTPASTTVSTHPTVPPTDVPPVTSGDSLVDLAVADLRAMVGDGGDITVITQDEVVWPDGALGCPMSGMSYTQALVDGSRIVLGHGGTEYAYHSGRAGQPFYCPPMRRHGSDS